MSTSTPSSLLADADTELATGPRRHRIPIELLELGLFVTELDRPWLDTPFLIQGFLVDSQVELTTLKKYCQHVFVDLEASDAGAVAQLWLALGEAPETPEQTVAIVHSESFRQPSDAVAPEASATVRPPLTERELRDASRDEAVREAERALDDVDPMLLYSPPPIAESAPDPTREPVEEAPARARAQAQPGNRVFKPRSDVRISRETRDRFRDFVRQTSSRDEVRAEEEVVPISQRVFGSLRAILQRGKDKEPVTAKEPGRQTAKGSDTERKAPLDKPLEVEIVAALPPGVPRQRYEVRHEVAREMPRARQSFESSQAIMATMLSDIRQNKVLEVARVKDSVNHMVDSMSDNPDALMWVAQMRQDHENTYQHGVRVSLYMIALGRQLGFPKEMLESLGLIGMLADVGKTKLPRALLDKPGMLSTAEFNIVKEHVQLGVSALSTSMKLAPEVELGILQHHERLDGTGYPNGLKGQAISIYGRMAAIADCFAALITPRPYANPLAPQDALMSLYQWADSSFHGPLVEQFVQAVGVFPVGGMVELSNGEVAVVVAHNRVRRLEPRVLVLTSAEKQPLPVPMARDLLQQSRDAGAKAIRIVRGLPSGAYGLKLRDYYAEEPQMLAGTA